MHRRQGVATAALAGALDLIASLGGGTVEGYPEDAQEVPAGFLFNGALSTYEKLRFTRHRKIGAVLILGVPRDLEEMTIGIGEVPGVDAERAHVGGRGERASSGFGLPE